MEASSFLHMDLETGSHKFDFNVNNRFHNPLSINVNEIRPRFLIYDDSHTFLALAIVEIMCLSFFFLKIGT